MGFSKYAIVKRGWAEIAIEGCRPGRQRLNAVQLHSSPPLLCAGNLCYFCESYSVMQMNEGENNWRGKLSFISTHTFDQQCDPIEPSHPLVTEGFTVEWFLGSSWENPLPSQSPPWQHNPSHGKQIASEPFSFPCLCYKVTHKPSTRLKFSFVFLPQTVIRLWILFRFRLVNIVLAVCTALPYIYNIIYTTFIYFTARKIRYQRKVIFGKMTSANSFVVLIVCCVTKCWNDSDKAPAQGVQKVEPHQIRAIVKRINYMINSFVVAYQLLRLFCACVVMIGFQWD